jgi:hypothetical protein
VKNTFVEKLASGFWGKTTARKSVAGRSGSTIRDLPSGTDYRLDALQRTRQEAPIADRVAEQLLPQFPDLEWHIEKFRSSYHEFAETGVTLRDGFYSFRHLYFATQGVSNQLISEGLSDLFPRPALPRRISSIFGTFDQGEVQRMVDDLRRDGIVRVNPGLSPEYAQAFVAGVGFSESGESAAVTDNIEPLLHVPESKLLATPIVNRIASDPLFYFVASEYLETEPILFRSAVWLSKPHNNSYDNLDNSAQLFHVDMSIPKFLQVFLYLNDVDENNGPHCMIPGTHREKPAALWRDGRISDEEMVSLYPSETWRLALGSAGTFFIVDTSAFHKGVAPVSGVRQVCSLGYINTLFGEHLPISPEAPRFQPKNFGPQVADFSPRFLSRFAMGLD